MLMLLALLSVAGRLAGQEAELREWYRESSPAERYLDHQEEILAILNEAEDARIASSLLMLVLREGAAKRVPPRRLVSALEAELQRLIAARAILTETDLTPSEQKALEEALRAISVYQTAGLETETIAAVLGASEDLAKGLSAVSALASIQGIQNVDQSTLADLGLALLDSRLRPATYPSLSSAYLRGTLNGLPGHGVVAIMIDVLNRGGGLIQIDRELNVRGERR